MRPTDAAGDRDRDDAGRAHNARPRDAYGRPLPRGSAGEPTVSDDEAARFARDPRAALAEAQRLLDADRPFHAHEVLEAVWKGAPGQEREVWRGLAQIAVGLTHLRRGNPTGACALLTRGADRIENFSASGERYGLAVPNLVADVRTLVDRVKNDEPGVLAARLVLIRRD